MSQEPAYEQAIRDKCNDNSLTTILTLYGQQLSGSDTQEDKLTRVLTLLSSQELIAPDQVVDTIVKKMRVADVRRELERLQLSTDGGVAVCKERLTGFLMDKSEEVSSDKDDIEYSHSPASDTHPSAEFTFKCSLPSDKDFLRTSQTTATKSKRKRQSQAQSTAINFKGIKDYLDSLDSASNAELTADLEVLRLNTDGNVKAKRKRIKQHLNKFHQPAQSPDPNLVDNRLSLIENSQVNISSKLDELNKEVNSIGLSISSPERGVAGTLRGKMHDTALDRSLTDKLTKSTNELNSLLERSERSTTELKSAIKETSSLKKDLEKWSNSVFKGTDSERIEDIHRILTTKSPPGSKAESEVSKPFDQRYRARRTSVT